MPSKGSSRVPHAPNRYKPTSGAGSKLVITPHASVPSAKRKRRSHPMLMGDQDAMADATAGAMSMDARAPPGDRPKTVERLRNKTHRAASEASEETGEGEDDGERGEDSADGAAGEEGEEEGSEEDSHDGEDKDSEDSKQESESGSDSEAQSEAERDGQRKLQAASAAKKPKVSDKGGQGKTAVDAKVSDNVGPGKKVVEAKAGQGIREEKPVKESTQGKKNTKVMLVIICDTSQSGR